MKSKIDESCHEGLLKFNLGDLPEEKIKELRLINLFLQENKEVMIFNPKFTLLEDITNSYEVIKLGELFSEEMQARINGAELVFVKVPQDEWSVKVFKRVGENII